MRRWGVLTAALMLLAACTRFPKIEPMPSAEALAAPALCRTPFVQTPWQFVHALSADMPGGSRTGRLIGVTVVDPGPRTLQAALMTVEGLVLFAAQWNGNLAVSRALPPFDSPLFAKGLMADIRLLFLPPEGPPSAIGREDGGLPSCRYMEDDGTAVDVLVAAGQAWEMRRYGPDGRPERTVKARELTSDERGGVPIATYIELTAHGSNGYHLTLNLISSEPVEGQAGAAPGS